MPEISITGRINAPLELVWSVLDDFGDIARWSPGILRSELTSIGPVGPGTTRRCDFKPFGSAVERIEVHVPNERLKVRLDDISGMPLSEAYAEFNLAARDSGTELRFVYVYTPKRFARLLGGIFRRMMARGMAALVDGLEAECERMHTHVGSGGTSLPLDP